MDNKYSPLWVIEVVRTEILTRRNKEVIRIWILGVFCPLIVQVVLVRQYLAFLNGGNKLEKEVVEEW